MDELNLSSNLPTYIASSPDTMPSLLLYDGVKMIVKMLRANLLEYGSAVVAGHQRSTTGVERFIAR